MTLADVTTSASRHHSFTSSGPLHVDVLLVLLATRPLVGCLALCAPGMYAGNLVAQRGIDEAVALEGIEGVEGGRDDDGCKGLATAAWGKGERGGAGGKQGRGACADVSYLTHLSP